MDLDRIKDGLVSLNSWIGIVSTIVIGIGTIFAGVHGWKFPDYCKAFTCEAPLPTHERFGWVDIGIVGDLSDQTEFLSKETNPQSKIGNVPLCDAEHLQRIVTCWDTREFPSNEIGNTSNDFGSTSPKNIIGFCAYRKIGVRFDSFTHGTESDTKVLICVRLPN